MKSSGVASKRCHVQKKHASGATGKLRQSLLSSLPSPLHFRGGREMKDQMSGSRFRNVLFMEHHIGLNLSDLQ